jgi:RNA polymerase sigma factor (sigma-70 family)
MAEQTWTMPLASSDPDLTLIRAIAGGDERALDELYARHGPALLAYLVGRLGDRGWAEEVLQDVMLAAWDGAARFRGQSRVCTWLLAIARYRAINAQRRRALPRVPLDEAGVACHDSPLGALERKATQDQVRRALGRLPDDQRETLELIFYHQLTGPEAAVVLDVAPGTIKSRLHRAKAALRQWLQAEDIADV